MARKKQRAGVQERISSWWQTRTRRQAEVRKQKAFTALKVVVVMCFLAATSAFLRYAEGYVRQTRPTGEGALVLLDVPEWVNWNLKARVVAAAGGNHFPIREDTAQVVARNLDSVSWLDDIEVQVTYDAVQVKAKWRKPIALLDRGPSRFYVDEDLCVLDYMPMDNLTIVEVKEVAQGLPPAPGSIFDREDLAAAVKLIILLARMDAEIAPRNPLLDQIAYIDVSNFKGHKNRHEPHLVLYSRDGAQIEWGAEIGEWGKYLEAKDEQKLAKLYTYYKEYGSLRAGGKYINLYDPQDKVPQPIDHYW
ncbi:MAG: hypothetical protein JW993_17730 [Sedimentisphaerales bacterium]|nr:hypothetical protein [Sedimentisphaerales bacterium]